MTWSKQVISHPKLPHGRREDGKGRDPFAGHVPVATLLRLDDLEAQVQTFQSKVIVNLSMV